MRWFLLLTALILTACPVDTGTVGPVDPVNETPVVDDIDPTMPPPIPVGPETLEGTFHLWTSSSYRTEGEPDVRPDAYVTFSDSGIDGELTVNALDGSCSAVYSVIGASSDECGGWTLGAMAGTGLTPCQQWADYWTSGCWTYDPMTGIYQGALGDEAPGLLFETITIDQR